MIYILNLMLIKISPSALAIETPREPLLKVSIGLARKTPPDLSVAT